MFVLIKYALLINLVTLAAFGWDKSSARLGHTRLRELSLLRLGLLGGGFGLKLGQWLFNHKKAPYPLHTKLNSTIWINLLSLIIAGVLYEVTT
jgi:uncharacterized membrane protein YsdA (DUF1294 family)